MRKSTKMFRVAFAIGLLLCPFVIMMDRENLGNLWFVVPFGLTMLVMLGFTFYAFKLEERGE